VLSCTGSHHFLSILGDAFLEEYYMFHTFYCKHPRIPAFPPSLYSAVECSIVVVFYE
jgi:hypothetical protein